MSQDLLIIEAFEMISDGFLEKDMRKVGKGLYHVSHNDVYLKDKEPSESKLAPPDVPDTNFKFINNQKEPNELKKNLLRKERQEKLLESRGLLGVKRESRRLEDTSNTDSSVRYYSKRQIS